MLQEMTNSKPFLSKMKSLFLHLHHLHRLKKLMPHNLSFFIFKYFYLSNYIYILSSIFHTERTTIITFVKTSIRITITL